MQRPTVVIDKCFLQGSKADRIRELCLSHNVLMTDVLFYELISSSEPQRSRCFAKLPPTDNPVTLIQNTGALLRKEIDSHIPCGKPSKNQEEVNYRFNPNLSAENYVLPESASEALMEENERTLSNVGLFLRKAQVIPEIFPSLLSGSDVARKNAKEEAFNLIASDTDLIIKFYSELEPPSSEKPQPPSEIITPSWAIFRWIQIQLLISVDIFSRRNGNIPEASALARTGGYEKIEHDVLDAEYLLLGVLEGSFATRDRKLQNYWQLLCPGGVLMQ